MKGRRIVVVQRSPKPFARVRFLPPLPTSTSSSNFNKENGPHTEFEIQCENSVSTITQLLITYVPLGAIAIPIIYAKTKYKKVFSTKMFWALVIGILLGILTLVVLKMLLPNLCTDYPREIIAV